MLNWKMSLGYACHVDPFFVHHVLLYKYGFDISFPWKWHLMANSWIGYNFQDSWERLRITGSNISNVGKIALFIKSTLEESDIIYVMTYRIWDFFYRKNRVLHFIFDTSLLWYGGKRKDSKTGTWNKTRDVHHKIVVCPPSLNSPDLLGFFYDFSPTSHWSVVHQEKWVIKFVSVLLSQPPPKNCTNIIQSIEAINVLKLAPGGAGMYKEGICRKWYESHQWCSAQPHSGMDMAKHN